MMTHPQKTVIHRRPSFPGMGIPMLKIRRSWDRLIFNMTIHILVRRYLLYWNRPHVMLRLVSPPGGKHNAPLLLFTWKMFILTDLTSIYVLENISSRISTYFSSILCLWNHTMCPHCFALTCKLKWDFDYNSSFSQRLPSGNNIGIDNGLELNRRQAII